MSLNTEISPVTATERPVARPPATKVALRWRGLWRIAQQQARETALGWAIYVVVALAVLVAVILVYNAIRFTLESGLNIVVSPFFLPLQVALSLAILFVAVEATLAIARPREHGSLQVLFFAPIDYPVLVGAHYLSGLAVYVLFLALLALPLFLLAWATNFVVPPALLWGLPPSLLVAGLAVSFGLFISAAAPSGRVAILFLIAATLLLVVVQGGYAALLNIPPTSRYYDALLFLRVLLRQIHTFLQWVSPFRMLDALLGAAMRADWVALLQYSSAALLGTAAWLAAAIWAIRRRGVLP